MSPAQAHARFIAIAVYTLESLNPRCEREIVALDAIHSIDPDLLAIYASEPTGRAFANAYGRAAGAWADYDDPAERRTIYDFLHACPVASRSLHEWFDNHGVGKV